MSVGKYTEQLLVQEKYGEMPLPRIGLTLRKSISKRIALYEQFRQRYSANLEVLDRFDNAGASVEICNQDGDWFEAVTLDSKQHQGRCITVHVKVISTGEEQQVSLGMLICPPRSGEANPRDLTR